MPSVLLIEDDQNLGKGLKANLELEMYSVIWVQSIQNANIALKEKTVDIILLDLNLPDGTGFNFCRKIREAKVMTPVIILTADSDEDSVVKGFNVGANDYVKKPFSSKELFARLKAQLAINSVKTKEIQIGELIINQELRKVVFRKTEIDLNRREFDLLYYLITRRETISTRENIIAHLGQSDDVSDRTIDSHISHLRTKLKKSGITTISIKSEYGLGYRLVTDV